MPTTRAFAAWGLDNFAVCAYIVAAGNGSGDIERIDMPNKYAKVEFFVPSKDEHGKPIMCVLKQGVVKDVIGTCVRNAGGCSVREEIGYYSSTAGKVMEEETTVITCYWERATMPALIIHNTAHHILTQLHQECVLVVINGKPFFMNDISFATELERFIHE